MKFEVEISYTFIIDAENDDQAGVIADNAIGFYVYNPQTKEAIQPAIWITEKSNETLPTS